MTLKEHIDGIRDSLKKGLFIGEAAVSQGIVLRLLGAMAWPTFNTQVVAPEYGVEGTRVDFALCHPPSKPRVFIEAKQVGNIQDDTPPNPPLMLTAAKLTGTPPCIGGNVSMIKLNHWLGSHEVLRR